MMLLLNIYNFFYVLTHPDGIKLPGEPYATYFWGTENQMGYPLIIGLLFVIMAYQAGVLSKIYLTIYLCLHAISLVIIFSGTTLVGFCIALMFLINIPPVSWFSKFSLSKLVCIFLGIFVFLFLFDGLVSFVKSDYVKYVIEDVLGKDTTMSGREVIWKMAVQEISKHPFLGNGIRESYNIFNINNHYLSAHNQLLQSLYEGGIMLFVAFIPLVNLASKSLKCQSKSVTIAFKAITLAILVMYMGEAMGLTTIMLILILASLIHIGPENKLVEK